MRSDILSEPGPSPNHRKFADANELVENRPTTQHRAVADVDITSQEAIIGNDHAISQGHIVAQV